MFKNRISSFVATFLIVGFFFLALPEKGYSQLGCCITDTGCTGCGSLEICAILDEYCDGVEFKSGAVCVGQFTCADTGDNSGCCVLADGSCTENEVFGACDSAESIAWFENESCSDVPECAEPIARNVPTLNQWSIIVLVGILGIIGLIMVLRRKKASA